METTVVSAPDEERQRIFAQDAHITSPEALERRLPGRLQRVALGIYGVEWLLKPADGGAPARVLIGRPRDSDIPAAALMSVLSRSGPTPTVIDLRTPDTPVLTFAASR